MAIPRSREFTLVGYFLSRRSVNVEETGRTAPPLELNVTKWDEAYDVFFDTVSSGRTVITHRRSLKNTRDSFDAKHDHVNRRGWEPETGGRLTALESEILERWSGETDQSLWEAVSQYATSGPLRQVEIELDIMAIERSESEGEVYGEGRKKYVVSPKKERSSKAKKQALHIHGVECMVCGFRFGEVYGEWGLNFIEVHHSVQISEGERETDPEKDLAVVCANCHRMIHKKRDRMLSISELKRKISAEGLRNWIDRVDT